MAIAPAGPALPPPDTIDAPTATDTIALAVSLAEQARAYAQAAKAPSTLRAYRSDWRHFAAWCLEGGRASLPSSPETVALYLAAWAPLRANATLTRRLTAISKAHEAAGYPSPATMAELAVSETLKGIRRTHGVAQRRKEPLVTADVQRLVQQLVTHTGMKTGARGDRKDPGAPELSALRDRALVLLSYAGALRRSEPAALRVGDLAWPPKGLVLTLRRSKTDQEGRGRQVAIPRGRHAHTCPVRAVEGWMEAAGLDKSSDQHRDAPLFRAIDRHGNLQRRALHPNSVGEILKRVVTRAGYPPAAYGGHSLRAGFCTEAARSGASAFEIMRQTGHRSVATVARYIREAELFRDAPASKLGL